MYRKRQLNFLSKSHKDRANNAEENLGECLLRKGTLVEAKRE